MSPWLGLGLLAVPAGLFLYSYVVYPLMLGLLALFRRQEQAADPLEWPEVTLLVPVYNEVGAIAGTLDALLAVDYPRERVHILVVSDASTDGTDEVVGGYGARGVELVRVPRRGGKTGAENEAGSHLRGGIVVNTDATIHIPRGSLKPLVAAFEDPTVGVASGRDKSVGDLGTEANSAELGYVNYEMWVRDLETRLGSIVGASGCFYAIRRDLFDGIFPEALSRDFASPLIAREAGYRSVSVPAAVALVTRTRSLRSEYRRKVRTMTRGLETLWYERALLNPFRHGLFAFMLFSHKLCRWLVFLTGPLAVVGLGLLAGNSPAMKVVLSLGLVAGGVGTLAIMLESRWRLPRVVAFCGFLVASSAAGFVAWIRALAGELDPVWEPTRRPQAARAE